MAVDISYSREEEEEEEEEQDQHQDQGQEQDQDQDQEEEDEYIDMEVSSFYSNFVKGSPIQQANEFEFMTTKSGPLNQDHLSTSSPADELFFNGKLLPLHYHYYPSSIHSQKEFYSTPLTTNATNTPTSGTPFLSCNVSPAESCHVSKELNPKDYFLECSNGSSKKSVWSKKLKLGSKIKASQAYLKYLFSKAIEKNKDEKQKTAAATTTTTTKDDAKVCHRRSFSGAFKLRVVTKTKPLTSSSSSGSSSSSSNSNGSTETRIFMRRSSANLELDSAIAGAIAHCKLSQSSQVIRSRKTLSEIGAYNSE